MRNYAILWYLPNNTPKYRTLDWLTLDELLRHDKDIGIYGKGIHFICPKDCVPRTYIPIRYW